MHELAALDAGGPGAGAAAGGLGGVAPRAAHAPLTELLALPADIPAALAERAWPILGVRALRALPGKGCGLATRCAANGGSPWLTTGRARRSAPGRIARSNCAGPTWPDGETRVLALAVLDVFAQTWLSRMRSAQAVAVALAQRAGADLLAATYATSLNGWACWPGSLVPPRLSGSRVGAAPAAPGAPAAGAMPTKLLAATGRQRRFPPDEPPVRPGLMLHNAAGTGGPGHRHRHGPRRRQGCRHWC